MLPTPRGVQASNRRATRIAPMHLLRECDEGRKRRGNAGTFARLFTLCTRGMGEHMMVLARHLVCASIQHSQLKIH